MLSSTKNVNQFEPFVLAVEQFVNSEDGSIRRLLHGRGGCFEGLDWLTADGFNNTVLCTFFKEPPAEFEGVLKKLITKIADNKFQLICQHRYQKGTPFEVLVGNLLQSEWVQQAGLRYQLRFNAQNTGLFLDMELAREWLAQRVQGKKVLNLFAYTCAFSVVAMAKGASACVNVDMSSSALSWGRENHRANDLTCENVHFMALNILKSWSRIKKQGPYDVVIIDPPSFQKGSFVAMRDYYKLIKRLPELCAPGADVLACLNAPEISPEFLTGLFKEHCPEAQFQNRLPLPDTFCDVDTNKQLKMLHYAM